ncbi:hypothetical protein MTO96_030521 [Rhipicephalus appendiculatus]
MTSVDELHRPPCVALRNDEVIGGRPQQSQEPLMLLRVGPVLDAVQVGVYLRGLLVFSYFSSSKSSSPLTPPD